MDTLSRGERIVHPFPEGWNPFPLPLGPGAILRSGSWVETLFAPFDNGRNFTPVDNKKEGVPSKHSLLAYRPAKKFAGGVDSIYPL